MLGLANYGSSGSENEISDEEDDIQPKIGLKSEEQDDLIRRTSKIQLPQPATNKSHIVEEDDEFLHKKAEPSIAPPKRGKVKISIPRLSDFKEDDEKIVKIQPANRKTGLLSMLSKPSSSFAPAPRPPPAAQPVRPKMQGTSGAVKEQPKKVGLIPYALMSHNPKADNSKANKKKDNDSDSDENDDEPGGSFFTFDSKDEDLPKVSEDEVNAMVAKETARMEQRKRQHEGIDDTVNELEALESDQQQHQFYEKVDAEAMKALLGGNKAKRSRIDNIQIIDLSAAEVLPDRAEWLRKSLAGETSYIPTGNIVEKVKIEMKNKFKYFFNVFKF